MFGEISPKIPGVGNINPIVNLSTAPVSSNTATTLFGTSMTAGTSKQNTASYDILVTINLDITAATAGTITLGIGPMTGPTTNTVIASFTVAATAPVVIPAYVPSGYWVVFNTTGSVTIGSVTTMAMPI